MKKNYEDPQVEITPIRSDEILTESGGAFDLEEDEF